MASWSTRHTAICYAAGIAGLFVGSSIAHSIFKPSQALPDLSGSDDAGDLPAASAGAVAPLPVGVSGSPEVPRAASAADAGADQRQ